MREVHLKPAEQQLLGAKRKAALHHLTLLLAIGILAFRLLRFEVPAYTARSSAIATSTRNVKHVLDILRLNIQLVLPLLDIVRFSGARGTRPHKWACPVSVLKREHDLSLRRQPPAKVP